MMMKNVAIATDSHSSITPEMAQTLGVAVLPMPFTIDAHPRGVLCASAARRENRDFPACPGGCDRPLG